MWCTLEIICIVLAAKNLSEAHCRNRLDVGQSVSVIHERGIRQNNG